MTAARPPAMLPDVRGWLLDRGRRVRCYAALRPLRCVRCGHRIPTGALFTKGRAAARSHGNLHPVCYACAPILIGCTPLELLAAIEKLEEAHA